MCATLVAFVMLVDQFISLDDSNTNPNENKLLLLRLFAECLGMYKPDQDAKSELKKLLEETPLFSKNFVHNVIGSRFNLNGVRHLKFNENGTEAHNLFNPSSVLNF